MNFLVKILRLTMNSDVVILLPSDEHKYHDIECCEWTRGVDSLLELYERDRDEIIDLMENNPNVLIETIWKINGPLAIDNECKCKMGSGNRRSPFSCAQCKNLRRLINFKFGGVETIFRIECSNNIGEKLIVSETKISIPFLEWDDISTLRAQVYVNQYKNLSLCGTSISKDMRCITGDPFTIKTLIMWIVMETFMRKDLPHYHMLYTSFICNNKGYSLYGMKNILSMNNLHKIDIYHNISTEPNKIVAKEEKISIVQNSVLPLSRMTNTIKSSMKFSIVRTIITQLLVILLELSSINFSHGNPSINGLLLSEDPVSYLYDEFHVKGEITVHIADMSNSSATFGNNHYFPKNINSMMYIENNMFIPEIDMKEVSMAYCHENGISGVNDNIVCPSDIKTCPNSTTFNLCQKQNVMLYRLTNSTIDIYTAMRHIGFPLYVGSFDFYCFMVALMCDKLFFEAVIGDEKLYRLWSMMWLAEDIGNVEQSMRKFHDMEVANSEVVDIVRGKWLRCDIVPYMWTLIKLNW